MIILAIGVFVALQFITPAYGMTFNNRWGMSIKSRIGWMLMEMPVFFALIILYGISLYHGVRPFNWVTFFIFILFELHYCQRSLIFPALMRGNSKMPLSIIFIGIVFNTVNAFMQGGWLFYFSPMDYYPISWFWSPQFIIGTIFFFSGMIINMHADRLIRFLRKDKNDNNYYIPQGWPFKISNSANYFGELLEWLGFAILLWAVSGWIFLLWSLANMIPRAKEVYEKYSQFFGTEFTDLKRKKLFPFIY
jgi:3-oxo-5-alpha-steroid 4-dehydrogenase 1